MESVVEMVFVCPGAQVDEPWKLPAGDTERGNGRSCDNWIMTNHMAATVVGGGAWGTALAKLLAGQGVPTMLWALEPEVVEAITSLRQNPVFLPGVRLPDALAVTGDLDVGAVPVLVEPVLLGGVLGLDALGNGDHHARLLQRYGVPREDAAHVLGRNSRDHYVGCREGDIEIAGHGQGVKEPHPRQEDGVLP